ncbi:hypothetical protein [Hydrocarboniphaga effusa]|uniref:hypothetical protein n=1 Tax=Hydrocarboniphaga effusa TaxID=243629 RepID=UPI003BAC35EB
MSKANMLAGVSVGLAVVTFITLNLIWPFKPTQETLKANPTSDSVFASDIASTPAADLAGKAQESEAAALPAVADSEPSAASDEAPAAPDTDAPNATPVQQQIAAVPEPSPAAQAPAPAESTSAPAPAEPSAEPAAAPSEPAAKPSKPKSTTAPRADALAQWWPSAPTPGRLNLLYAGQAAQSPAIALLFDSVFADTAAAGNAIRVVDGQGKTVSGSWELASNRRLLMLKAKPGRYTIVIGADLANQRGQTLGTELHGPVYVR